MLFICPMFFCHVEVSWCAQEKRREQEKLVAEAEAKRKAAEEEIVDFWEWVEVHRWVTAGCVVWEPHSSEFND